MEIFPLQLFRLCVASFVFGLLLGIAVSICHSIRVSFGLEEPSEKLVRLYETKLPFSKKPLRVVPYGRFQKIVLSLFLGFQDFSVLITAGVGITVLNYTFNDGKIRIYSILGVLLGAFLYHVSVKKSVDFLGEALLWGVRCVFSVTFFLIFAPISKILTIFYAFFIKILEKIKKTLVKRAKKVYNLYGIKALFQKADHGFLEEIHKEDDP